MKLIDILLQELPKIGGWPEGADYIATNGYWRVFAYWVGSSLKGRSLNIATNTDGYVTREQYEAALAASKPEWDGEGLPPVGIEAEVSVDGGRTWCLYKATSEHNGMRLVEIGNFTEEFQINNWTFLPVRSEADKKKEEAVFAIAELCRGSASNGHSAELIYDAIRSGKIVID